MHEHRPRLLLIDDDPVFGHIMEQTADHLKVDLDVVQSVDQVGFIAGMKEYDIIIVDQNMQFMSGMEVAAYISSFFETKTVILISSSPVVKDGGLGLPSFVSAFISKDEGYYRVLKKALATYQQFSGFPEPGAAESL